MDNVVIERPSDDKLDTAENVIQLDFPQKPSWFRWPMAFRCVISPMPEFTCCIGEAVGGFLSGAVCYADTVRSTLMGLSMHSLRSQGAPFTFLTINMLTLEDAISLHREVLELEPAPRLDRSSSLNNLAVVLRMRYDRSNQHEEAISLYREALDLRPAPHPNQSISLHKLAVALCKRFEALGQHEDVEEAISLHRDALELRPASHLERPNSLGSFATVLCRRFEQHVNARTWKRPLH
jgi:tetratricopeptide (TPR) repeat protein